MGSADGGRVGTSLQGTGFRRRRTKAELRQLRAAEAARLAIAKRKAAAPSPQRLADLPDDVRARLRARWQSER